MPRWPNRKVTQLALTSGEQGLQEAGLPVGTRPNSRTPGKAGKAEGARLEVRPDIHCPAATLLNRPRSSRLILAGGVLLLDPEREDRPSDFYGNSRSLPGSSIGEQ